MSRSRHNFPETNTAGRTTKEPSHHTRAHFLQRGNFKREYTTRAREYSCYAYPSPQKVTYTLLQSYKSKADTGKYPHIGNGTARPPNLTPVVHNCEPQLYAETLHAVQRKKIRVKILPWQRGIMRAHFPFLDTKKKENTEQKIGHHLAKTTGVLHLYNRFVRSGDQGIYLGRIPIGLKATGRKVLLSIAVYICMHACMHAYVLLLLRFLFLCVHT